MLSMRPATERDVKSLAPRLREADVNEIQAASGSTPEVALMCGLKTSTNCWVIVESSTDNPIAIFGVTKENSAGVVWMVASDELLQHRMEFLRHSRVIVDWLMTKYPVLHNFIDSRNYVHQKWVRWCGFEVVTKDSIMCHDPKVPFYYFSRWSY